MTETTTERLTMTAADLLPGDIRIDVHGHGERMHACYDVQTVMNGEWVQVWTATSDQEDGEPADYLIPADFPVVVDRRTGGPTLTHTTLTPVVLDDGQDAVEITTRTHTAR